MQHSGPSLNADLQAAYKGEKDEIYSRGGSTSSKPRSQRSSRSRADLQTRPFEPGAETQRRSGNAVPRH